MRASTARTAMATIATMAIIVTVPFFIAVIFYRNNAAFKKILLFLQPEFYFCTICGYIRHGKRDRHRTDGTLEERRRVGLGRIHRTAPAMALHQRLAPAGPSRCCSRRRAGNVYPPLAPPPPIQPPVCSNHLAPNHLHTNMLQRTAPSATASQSPGRDGLRQGSRHLEQQRTVRIADTNSGLAACQTATGVPTARAGRTRHRRGMHRHRDESHAGEKQPMGCTNHRERKDETIWNTMSYWRIRAIIHRKRPARQACWPECIGPNSDVEKAVPACWA